MPSLGFDVMLLRGEDRACVAPNDQLGALAALYPSERVVEKV
jgi:hypothetical protein